MDQKDAQSGPDQAEQNQKEAKTEEVSMESLLAQGDFSLDMPKQGEIRKGVIASITGEEILVSIGAKSEGVIPSRELTQLSEDEKEKLAVGEEIQVFVVSPESRQGTMILSIVRALEEDDWVQAETLMKNNEVYQSEVTGYNKGGLIVNMGNLRGFVPASQVSLSRRMTYSGDTPDERWSKMVGEPIVVRVIEVDRQRRRLIFSEKAASQESRDSLKDIVLQELEEGVIRKGRVTSLADFGAFVNINGADGLVHLSEISWERIEHPKEVLEVGQEVEVKVISIDRERRRIGLSLRQLQSDPWEDYVKDYQVGQLIEGTITRLTKFGAFARIDENLEGLIHVSELSDKRIEHPKEVLNENDIVTLRIIKIDMERRRIGLSLRKVESMQYSELDWEMALADIEGLEEFVAEEPPSEEVIPETSPEEKKEAESDTPEAEAEESPEASAKEAKEPAPESPKPEAEAEESPEASAEEVEEQQAESDTPDAEPAENTEESNEAETED
jgi:small subunit ribosomal protein S1